MVVLLDGNGFIAGIQTVAMKEYAVDEVFNFTNSPYYVLGDWNGEEAYFTTAYFVDTAIICNGGRTEEEFLSEGTGNRLSFQNGPTNMDLQEIPLTKDEMLGNVSVTDGFVIGTKLIHLLLYRTSGGSTPAVSINCEGLIHLPNLKNVPIIWQLATWVNTTSISLLLLEMTMTAMILCHSNPSTGEASSMGSFSRILLTCLAADMSTRPLPPSASLRLSRHNA